MRRDPHLDASSPRPWPPAPYRGTGDLFVRLRSGVEEHRAGPEVLGVGPQSSAPQSSEVSGQQGASW